MQKLILYWIFAGIRVQSFSYSGQIFQVKTLDCSSTKCDILEVSIASDKPEVLASTNNTLNLCIEDYSPNSASCQREYLESCCQFVTFFRPASTEISQNLKKFPVINCLSSNRALNFFGKLWEISGYFLETFLLFSRKFPKICMSRNPTIFNIIRWVNGTNDLLTMHLMFQALCFS